MTPDEPEPEPDPQKKRRLALTMIWAFAALAALAVILLVASTLHAGYGGHPILPYLWGLTGFFFIGRVSIELAKRYAGLEVGGEPWGVMTGVIAALTALAVILLVVTAVGALIGAAYGQTEIIPITDGEPCFLTNKTGVDLWRSCGYGEDGDWLQAMATPYLWVTGGFLVPIVMAVVMLGTWMKYQRMQYPMMIGVMFLPVTFSLFPPHFVTTAVLFAGVGIAILIWWTVIRQTRD